MTPSGIEPATFRFVTQHLNHCATAVPIYTYVVNNKTLAIRICIFYQCALVGLIQKYKYKKDIL